MNIFKNKFFFRMFLISLSIVIFCSVLGAMGKITLLRNTFGTVAYPFRWCFTKVSQAIEGYALYFTEYDRIKAENEELRRQLAEYEDINQNADALSGENAWLRTFIGLKQEHIDFEFCDASIIARESDNTQAFYTLNKGSAHKIEVGMAVVTADGVFGSVKEVGLNWCKVLPITESASSVGVCTSRSGAYGLAEGSYALRRDNLCSMNYIRSDSDIKVGDTVITSGLGSVYPYGLKVGKIVSVKRDVYSRTLSAEIEPYTDFESATRVMIITGYEYVGEGADE